MALTLTPCPSSKLVSLPTTTTPPFIVPRAGRQRRVTDGRRAQGSKLTIPLFSFIQPCHKSQLQLTGFAGHQQGRTQAVLQQLRRTLNRVKRPISDTLPPPKVALLIQIKVSEHSPVWQSPPRPCSTACSTRGLPCCPAWLSPVSGGGWGRSPRTAGYRHGRRFSGSGEGGRGGTIKERARGVSDLRGGTLELQQHQGAGALQDVEVEEKRLLPVRE